MLNQIKALVVILVLASLLFAVAKPVCLKYMAEEDFIRRRNVWLALTICVFLSPNFWLYALVAAPLTFWAGRKDPNPAALYAVLLFAAPAASVFIPKLIAVDHQTILTLAVGIPALLGSRQPSQFGVPRPLQNSHERLPGFLLFLFCTIQALLFLRYESWTNVARRELSLLLNILVPFLLFSRTLRDRKAISDALACFALACAIMVPLALFESIRGWQLYVEKAGSWGAQVNPFAYLMRAGQLRAMVATGHSLGLGYVLAICFCFCLYLQRGLPKHTRVTIMVFVWAGLFASYSRGAWVTALLMMMLYFWMLPGGSRRIVKAMAVMAILALVLSPTSFGQRIFDALPFVGTVDTGSTDYRQRLLERSLEMIPRHPWFGDLLVRSKMADLMQGQGIVDLVNGYLNIALLYGLVTLTVVLLFLFLLIGKAMATSFKRAADPEDAALGMNLAACLMGSLLFIWTAGFSGQMWMLAGMCAAYAYLGKTEAAPALVPRGLKPATGRLR